MWGFLAPLAPHTSGFAVQLSDTIVQLGAAAKVTATEHTPAATITDWWCQCFSPGSRSDTRFWCWEGNGTYLVPPENNRACGPVDGVDTLCFPRNQLAIDADVNVPFRHAHALSHMSPAEWHVDSAIDAQPDGTWQQICGSWDEYADWCCHGEEMGVGKDWQVLYTGHGDFCFETATFFNLC